MSPTSISLDLESGQLHPGSSSYSSSSSPPLVNEDAAFLKKLERNVRAEECCSPESFSRSLFCVVRNMLRVPAFFFRCIREVLFMAYAYLSWELFGRPVSKVDRAGYLLSKYADLQGEVALTFQLLGINRDEQIRWVETWAKIDKNGDDSMSFDEFCEYFDFPKGTSPPVRVGDARNDDDYGDSSSSSTGAATISSLPHIGSHSAHAHALPPGFKWYPARLFALFDHSLTGRVSFKNFLTAAWTYAPLDAERCAELSFRLLSRRGGGAFDEERCLLDITDVGHFLKTRYGDTAKSGAKARSDKWQQERAMELYCFIDVDNQAGITLAEFKLFVKTNRTFLLYGYYAQSIFRRAVFGPDWWRNATEGRGKLFNIDPAFEIEMMGLMTWDAICSIGMNHGGEPLTKVRRKKYTFRNDFNEVWFKAKEDKFKNNAGKGDKDKFTAMLGVMTHTRMIHLFQKVLPRNLRTAFTVWKDVALFLRSIEKDGGQTYALSVMSLKDIRKASEAESVGAVTQKLAVKLANDFDAEADDGETKARNGSERRLSLLKEVKDKKELKVKEREELVGEVLAEIAKSKLSEFDLVRDQLKCETRRIETTSGAFGIDNVERIRHNPHILMNARNIAVEVAHRVDVRKGIRKHFDDKASGKENELQEPDPTGDDWGREDEDEDAGAIGGAFEMPTIGALAALESIRMLGMTPAMRAGSPSRRPSIASKTSNAGGGKKEDGKISFANRLTLSGAPGGGGGSSKRSMSLSMPR